MNFLDVLMKPCLERMSTELCSTEIGICQKVIKEIFHLKTVNQVDENGINVRNETGC